MFGNAKDFEDALTNIINNCGLSVSEAYYIVENAALQLKLLYTELVDKERYNQSFKDKNDITLELPVEQPAVEPNLATIQISGLKKEETEND